MYARAKARSFTLARYAQTRSRRPSLRTCSFCWTLSMFGSRRASGVHRLGEITASTSASSGMSNTCEISKCKGAYRPRDFVESERAFACEARDAEGVRAVQVKWQGRE